MTKHVIKRINLILCFLIVSTLFAGCENTKTQAKYSKTVQREARKRITLMTQDVLLGKAFDAYIERAQSATGLTIKVIPEPVNADERHAQITRVLSAGDSSIDIISINDEMISTFKNTGYIDSIEDIMTSDVLAHFPEKYMEKMVMNKGHVFSVPAFMDLLAFWIDEEKLKEAGMAEVRTKEDFLQFVKRTTSDESYGYGGAWDTMYAYNELGLFINLFDGDYYDWSNPKTREAVKFLYEMVKNKETPLEQIVDQYDQMMQKFFNKEYASAFMYTGAMQNFVASGRYGHDKIHIAPMPIFEKKATYIAAWHYVLNASSKNKEAAKIFLRYAASEQGARDYAETLMRFPVREDVLKNLEPSFYGLVEIQDYINHTELYARPMAEQAIQFIEAIGNLFRQYVSDEITLDEFCDAADKEVAKYFKKN